MEPVKPMSKTELSSSKPVGAQITEQTLVGHPVGVGGEAICVYCKDSITEGAECTAYAYRLAGESTLTVARLYCADCGRAEVRRPGRGCEEYIASAHLVTVSDVTTQTHHLALGGVSVVDHSPADDGGRLR